jgi:hypothetical protein
MKSTTLLTTLLLSTLCVPACDEHGLTLAIDSGTDVQPATILPPPAPEAAPTIPIPPPEAPPVVIPAPVAPLPAPVAPPEAPEAPDPVLAPPPFPSCDTRLFPDALVCTDTCRADNSVTGSTICQVAGIFYVPECSACTGVW